MLIFVKVFVCIVCFVAFYGSIALSVYFIADVIKRKRNKRKEDKE